MITATTVPGESTVDVAALIRPLRRRLVVRLIAQRGSKGTAIALAGVAAIVFYSRVSPWPGAADRAGATVLAIAYVLAVVIGTGIRIAVDWPSLAAAIRHADRVLGLKNRLATAYEFGDRPDRIAGLQRAELLSRLKGTKLADAVVFRVSRRHLTWLAASVLLILIAVALPNLHRSSSSQDSEARLAARQAQRLRATC